jgi:hypothetical protein
VSHDVALARINDICRLESFSVDMGFLVFITSSDLIFRSRNVVVVVFPLIFNFKSSYLNTKNVGGTAASS